MWKTKWIPAICSCKTKYVNPLITFISAQIGSKVYSVLCPTIEKQSHTSITRKAHFQFFFFLLSIEWKCVKKVCAPLTLMTGWLHLGGNNLNQTFFLFFPSEVLDHSSQQNCFSGTTSLKCQKWITPLRCFSFFFLIYFFVLVKPFC